MVKVKIKITADNSRGKHEAMLNGVNIPLNQCFYVEEIEIKGDLPKGFSLSEISISEVKE